MIEIIDFSIGWKFTKDGETSIVNLPHTWNGIDGQSGADYYRGKCSYEKELPALDDICYLEINGANSVATVYLNGKKIAKHSGGYSTFRVYLTPHLELSFGNVLRIDVDNRDDKRVYPSTADFTFYGGLYRPVYLINGLPEAHFDIQRGRQGIFATPIVNEDGSGTLKVRAYTVGTQGNAKIKYALYTHDWNLVAETTADVSVGEVTLEVPSPTLWNGLENPYLYRLKCSLSVDGVDTDVRLVHIGFRTVTFDAEKGCFLNGKPIKLKGVSRHQDRLGIGNALTEIEHREDIALILELGANSVRLAHYQQDQMFYDLCDEAGLLVWAEVPVISRFSRKKQANAESQLTELITQCYNHPSIFCWGIQNEITIGGKAKGVERAVKKLNKLAHSLDPYRPTTSAQVMMCPPESSLNRITDILGYNLYYGWYVERYSSLGAWLDNFHAVNPNIKLCLSEYGAEAVLRYQTDEGVQGDYTESYQALMHDHYAHAIAERDWLWGSYVWNMFDFGAANRNEAGVKGRNNKGLVTIDRKIRKDAFYVYKAHWSQEPFVHILGKRYDRRPIGTTTVTVCSNLKEVTLTVNGKEYKSSCDKLHKFEGVELSEGLNRLILTSGECRDDGVVIGVKEADPSFKLPAGSASFVKNWFCSEGGSSSDYFSVNDRVADLMKSEEINTIIDSFLGGKKMLAKLIVFAKPFRIKTLLKLARIDEGMQAIAANYLQTIRKPK